MVAGVLVVVDEQRGRIAVLAPPGGGDQVGGAPFDLGYVAIALTLLAGSRPGSVVLTALFYGALTTGAKDMVIVTRIPLALLVVIVAFAIMFVAAPGLTRSIWRLGPPKPITETGAIAPVGPADSS